MKNFLKFAVFFSLASSAGFGVSAWAQGPSQCLMAVSPLTMKAALLKEKMSSEFGWNFDWADRTGHREGDRQIWALDAVINKGVTDKATVDYVRRFIEMIDKNNRDLNWGKNETQIEMVEDLLARSLSPLEKAGLRVVRLIGRGENSIQKPTDSARGPQSKQLDWVGRRNAAPRVWLSSEKVLFSSDKRMSGHVKGSYTFGQMRRKMRLLRALGFREKEEIAELFSSVVLGDHSLSNTVANYVAIGKAGNYHRLVKRAVKAGAPKLEYVKRQKMSTDELRVYNRQRFDLTPERLAQMSPQTRRQMQAWWNKLDPVQKRKLQRLHKDIERAQNENMAVLRQLKNSPIEPVEGTMDALPIEQLNDVFWFVTQHPVTRMGMFVKYDLRMVKGFCFGRSTHVAAELKLRGVNPNAIKKPWVNGLMQGDVMGLGIPFPSWQFHVSTVVKVSDGNWWVLDPFAGRPMKIDDWYHKEYAMDVVGNLRLTFSDYERFGGTNNVRYNMNEVFVEPVLDAQGRVVAPSEPVLPDFMTHKTYNGYFIDLAQSFSLRAYQWYKAKEEAAARGEDPKAVPLPPAPPRWVVEEYFKLRKTAASFDLAPEKVPIPEVTDPGFILSAINQFLRDRGIGW